MDFTINCMGLGPSQAANNDRKKVPAFCESREFITVFTTAHQIALHQDQSIPHAQNQ
jgi:hypothetical protein